MKDHNIHIRLEYEEAVQSKKDILSSEMNLLRIAKEIAKYKALRREELGMKIRLSKKIRETRTGLLKLQRALPKPELPEILQKHNKDIKDVEPDEREDKIKKTREKQDSNDIEYELQEIQDKLNMLGA
jgi:hypothetical protein